MYPNASVFRYQRDAERKAARQLAQSGIPLHAGTMTINRMSIGPQGTLPPPGHMTTGHMTTGRLPQGSQPRMATLTYMPPRRHIWECPLPDPTASNEENQDRVSAM